MRCGRAFAHGSPAPRVVAAAMAALARFHADYNVARTPAEVTAGVQAATAALAAAGNPVAAAALPPAVTCEATALSAAGTAAVLTRAAELSAAAAAASGADGATNFAAADDSPNSASDNESDDSDSDSDGNSDAEDPAEALGVGAARVLARVLDRAGVKAGRALRTCWKRGDPGVSGFDGAAAPPAAHTLAGGDPAHAAIPRVLKTALGDDARPRLRPGAALAAGLSPLFCFVLFCFVSLGACTFPLSLTDPLPRACQAC